MLRVVPTLAPRPTFAFLLIPISLIEALPFLVRTVGLKKPLYLVCAIFGNPHLIHPSIQEGRLRRQMKPVPDNPQLLFSICRFEVGILPTIRTMGVDQYYLTNERAKEKKVQGFLCVSDGGAVQAIACVFVVVC